MDKLIIHYCSKFEVFKFVCFWKKSLMLTYAFIWSKIQYKNNSVKY